MALLLALEAVAGLSFWTLSQATSTAYWVIRGVRESDEARMLREQAARLEEQERQLAYLVKCVRRAERSTRSTTSKADDLSESVVLVESDDESVI